MKLTRFCLDAVAYLFPVNEDYMFLILLYFLTNNLKKALKKSTVGLSQHRHTDNTNGFIAPSKSLVVSSWVVRLKTFDQLVGQLVGRPCWSDRAS